MRPTENATPSPELAEHNEAARAELEAMRAWLSDCEWADSPDFATLSDGAIRRGVEAHYDGGLAGFRADGAL
jgi:hypothetical protein